MKRRIRRYTMGSRAILDFLRRSRNLPDYIDLPMGFNIPDDAVVHHICEDTFRMSLQVVVEHPSFDEVDECDIPPNGGELNVKWMTLQTIAESMVLDLVRFTTEQLREIKDRIDCELYDRNKRP